MTTGQIVTVVAGIFGIIFGLASFFRNKKADDTLEGKTTGTVLSELGYIKAGVDDIKAEQKDQRQTNKEILERVSRVEESAKQAHTRIDELKHD